MTESAPAWPFLVGRGRTVGYRTLLAPKALLDQREQATLSRAVRRSASAEPSIVDIDTASLGPLTVVYRNRRLTDVAGPNGKPVYDEHGRPIDVLYGFVTPAGDIGRIEPGDLAVAEAAATQVMARFLADEEAVEPSAAEQFALRTPVALGRGPERRPEPPPNREPEPEGRRWSPVVATGVAAIALIVVLLRVWSGAPDLEVVAGADACRELNASTPSCRVVLASNVDERLELMFEGLTAALTVDTSCDGLVPPEGDCTITVTATPSLSSLAESVLVVNYGHGSLDIALGYSPVQRGSSGGRGR